MPTPRPEAAARLIEHILQRFHEGHRKAFPALLARARELGEAGGPPALVAQVLVFTEALEQHMFKEEMRLFPMMEQGGHSLIGHLIDDLAFEHAAHAQALAELERALAQDCGDAARQAPLRALRQAFAELAVELRAHIAAEDDELFPMFARPASAASFVG